MEQILRLQTDLVPRGDQAKAIEGLAQGIRAGYKHQTLLGVTGSGKTFTMAGVIEAVQRPTLVIAHNKTLACLLYTSSRTLAPNKAIGTRRSSGVCLGTRIVVRQPACACLLYTSRCV